MRNKTLYILVACLFASVLAAVVLGVTHRDEDIRRVTLGLFTSGWSEAAREP